MNQIDEVVMQIQRDINCLIDEDRNTRRSGLNKLLEFFKVKPQDNEVKAAIFEKYVVKNLLRAFEDKIEKHREIAYTILQNYLKFCKQGEIMQDISDVLVRALIGRLNQIPYPESSEELRLMVVSLLNEFISRSPQPFLPILPEYSNMLFKALNDQYPEMKKNVSQLCIDSSNKLGKYIGGYMLNVVKQISANMTHQHSKVRKMSVEALSPVVLCEGSGPYLEFAIQSLKTLTQDKALDVRKQTFLSISQLLQYMSVANLTIFENQLFLLLLNGLSDEHQDIQAETLIQLEIVGEKRIKLDSEI